MARKEGKGPRKIPIKKYPFSASTYPGGRPRFSFLFKLKGIFRVKLRTLDRFLGERKLPLLKERYAVLAYGSNACPGQLRQKCMENERTRALEDVPVLYGRLTGAEAAYAGRVTRMGYVPATLVRKKGSRSSWITFLTAEQLTGMGISEGRQSGSYVLAKTSAARFFIGRSEFVPLYAYVAARVMIQNGKPVSLRSMGQKRAKSSFDSESTAPAADWLDFEQIPYPNLPAEYSGIVRR